MSEHPLEDPRIALAIDDFVRRTLSDDRLREGACSEALCAHLQAVSRLHGIDPDQLQAGYCAMIEAL